MRNDPTSRPRPPNTVQTFRISILGAVATAGFIMLIMLAPTNVNQPTEGTGIAPPEHAISIVAKTDKVAALMHSPNAGICYVMADGTEQCDNAKSGEVAVLMHDPNGVLMTYPTSGVDDPISDATVAVSIHRGATLPDSGATLDVNYQNTVATSLCARHHGPANNFIHANSNDVAEPHDIFVSI